MTHEQLGFTGPFVRNDDPDASQIAANRIVDREGEMGVVRRIGRGGKFSNRYILLKIFESHPAGVSQEEAGLHALYAYDVGRNTAAGGDSGRRRCNDLEDMGLIEPATLCTHCGAAHDPDGGAFPDKRTTPWVLTDLGRRILERLDAGEKEVRTPWLR